MPGLGASFGRGAATTFQRDLSHSDCVLIMGSNMAEAHPVGFRWPLKARTERGAKLIHVDPRYTRTSALCDQHVTIRAGSDIAFLGGLIHYVLEHEKWFKEYVLHYTNAATLVDPEFQDTEELDGIFSGYDPEQQSYSAAEGHWGYHAPEEEMHKGPVGAGEGIEEPETSESRWGSGRMAKQASPKAFRDETLQDPRCVLNLLRKHYQRYTPEMVAQTCGCTVEQFLQVAETLCENSGRDRTSAIVYAVGWTQHSTGVQMIRAAGVLQLLLGNVGRPGGGIMAMRGHACIQGSTDIPTLYDLLPGYLPMPAIEHAHDTLEKYIEREQLSSGYWANTSRFIVSLLKAWYGDAATPENQFGFRWLPRLDGDHSQLPFFKRMANGEVEGFFLFGQNPAGGGPNAKLHREGLRNLDWLVVQDWFEIESAVFWKGDPDGPPPEQVKTEVFFLPCSTVPEKEGAFTNTDRLIQWHDQAADPPGDCRSDAYWVYELGKRLKRLYAGSSDPKDQAIQHLTWDYEPEHPIRLPDGSLRKHQDEPDVERVLQEINGWHTDQVDERTGKPKLLSGFSELKDDGSTACGGWIYSGVFPDYGKNLARSRELGPDNHVHPNWGFAWPENRRIMYNRASADPQGRPWSEAKAHVWWDEAQGRWTGRDVPDFPPDKRPDYQPPPDAKGMDAIRGDAPFIMHPDGRGWLFSAGQTEDGPLPVHYEPIESPVHNPLYAQQSNPVARVIEHPLNPMAPPEDPEYPVVATTFRLTEHYLSGPMSRFNSWLNELMPEMFVEISVEMAEEYGIEHGGWLTVSTPRAAIEARAMVTRRLKPLVLDGRIVHQIALPFHWGFAGETAGAIANDLTSAIVDPNVSIHGAKSFVVKVAAGRHSGRKQPEPSEDLVPWPTREPVPDTPPSAQPEGHLP